MKKITFSNSNDGFYGTYYINPNGADNAVIGLFGDDPNDYMAAQKRCKCYVYVA